MEAAEGELGPVIIIYLFSSTKRDFIYSNELLFCSVDIHIWIEKVDKPNHKIFTSRDLILRILNKCLDLVRCHQVYYEFQLYLVLKLSYQAEMRKITTRSLTLYTNHDEGYDFMNHLLKGRILHDETPIWWTLTLWTLLLIPIMLSDDNLPKYYKIVFVYGIHSLLNLVDSFLLNLARPETRPIWGLIGWEAMKLEDFQYLVRIAFMLFNLIFFRGLISNILTDNEEEQWSWTSLLPFWISSTMIFGNFQWIGSSLLFVMRLLVLMKILMPIGKEIVTNTPQIYTQISTRVREENSNHLRVICRLVFDRVYDINPTPQVILQALLKSVIIKGKVSLFLTKWDFIFVAMLHFISSLLQLNEKINPVINLSPQIENLQFTGMNSTGTVITGSSFKFS